MANQQKDATIPTREKTTEQQEDKVLLLRIAAGDEAAFESLYIRYARVLVPFLNKLTRNNGIAEDILQQTFLSLWLQRDRLSDVDNPKQWIFRIAANKTSTWMTKNAVTRKLENAVVTNETEGQQSTMLQVDFKEAQRLVNEAIDQLSPQRKKIFRLYRDHAMSYTEIATELNISASTVRTSVSIALEKVRDNLRETGLGFFIIFFLRQ